MYYQPSSAIDPITGKPIAYSSIEHITNDLTLGWLVRGMHRWGASVFVILLFLHMGRVFLFGAYKYPREPTWITGVLLLVTGMLMGFTGYLLPWDQTAYWATVVGINLNGRRPSPARGSRSSSRGPEIGRRRAREVVRAPHAPAPGRDHRADLRPHLPRQTRLGVVSPPWSSEGAGRERTPPPAGARAGLVRATAREGRSGRTASSTGEDFARYKDDVKKEGKAFRMRSGTTRSCRSSSCPSSSRSRRSGTWTRTASRPESSGPGTRSPPTRDERTSSRAPTGTSASSSTSSGS